MANKKHTSGAKLGRNVSKCSAYRARNNNGQTAKARRIARAAAQLVAHSTPVKIARDSFIGWIIREDGRAMPTATSRTKARRHRAT